MGARGIVHVHDARDSEVTMDSKMAIHVGNHRTIINDIDVGDYRAKFAFPFNYAAGQILAPFKHKAFFTSEYVDVTNNDLNKFFEPSKYLIVARGGDASLRFLYNLDGGIVSCQYSKSENSLNVEGYYLADTDSVLANTKLNETFPKKKEELSTVVPVEFWHNTLGEGHRTHKKLENTPSWAEISNNYTKNVKDYLTTLMGAKRIGGSDGRLILWRGLPGTGKTYAIRALIREWKEWCNAHYIIDPEAFFTVPAYLLNVLFRINEEERYDDDGNQLPVDKQKWNLLILEDAGELIVSDAKAQTGPALSKLLNLADGMLGQGMNLLVLITTNEEDNRLDRAVSRNGRCLSSILFTEFDSSEAQAWLDSKGVDTKKIITTNKTISDLYALANNSGTKKNVVERKVGFTS